MADRYSRKDAERAFDRLAYALGKQHTRWEQVDGRNVVNVGSWHLDCAPIYGGYVVNEICNEGGGITQPFGMLRHPARERRYVRHAGFCTKCPCRKCQSFDHCI